MSIFYADGFGHYGTGTAAVNNMEKGNYVSASGEIEVNPHDPTGRYAWRGRGDFADGFTGAGRWDAGRRVRLEAVDARGGADG